MEVSQPQFQPTLVSPSRIAAFIECPKKYDYIYRQELVKKGPAKRHFNKGNYFHELAHVYYQLIEAGTPVGSDLAVSQIVSRVRADFDKLKNLELVDVFNIITKAIIRYIKEHSPKIDKDLQVVGIEHELILPVNERFSLYGYADLVWRTIKGLVVRDHKTGEKAWSKVDVNFSGQLLTYAVILYMLTGEVPSAELNYINTKEYKTKVMTYEEAFTFTRVLYSERELKIYYEEICQVVELMLDSPPVPHYGQHCGYCPYQTPCYLSRKGIDPSNIISQHYVKVTRGKRHSNFTEEHSEDDSTN